MVSDENDMNPRTIILVKDLMLKSKIKGMAGGDSAVYLSSIEKLFLEIESQEVSYLIFDLTLLGPRIEEVIKACKLKLGTTTKIVCFGSHVDKDSFVVAKLAGADMVVPRSKFFSPTNRSIFM